MSPDERRERAKAKVREWLRGDRHDPYSEGHAEELADLYLAAQAEAFEPMTQPDLDELAEALGKMTPGEWEVWDGCSWRRIGLTDQSTPILVPTTATYDNHPDLDVRREDLDGIVTLRNAAPFLLAAARERDRLKAEVARLKAGGCARDQRTTQFCAEAEVLHAENDSLRAQLAALTNPKEPNAD